MNERSGGYIVYLDMNTLPRYVESSFRTFLPNEFHVDRVADIDVLLLVLSGRMIFGEDGERVEVNEGEWYIQRAGKHQTGMEPSLMPHYFYIHFCGEFCSEDGLPIRGSFSPQLFHDAIEQLDLAEKNGLSLLEKTRWFYKVLALLCDGNRRSVCPAVTEMQGYVAAHYAEQLDVRQLAEHFSYSPDHVIRLFRRYLGVTPHRYIARVRLTQAQRMLTTTDRTLQLIAVQTGFSDSTVLFRAFVRKTGMSPTAWKKEKLQR